MRLITWHVQRRIERLGAQSAALATREPDGTVISFARDTALEVDLRPRPAPG